MSSVEPELLLARDQFLIRSDTLPVQDSHRSRSILYGRDEGLGPAPVWSEELDSMGGRFNCICIM